MKAVKIFNIAKFDFAKCDIVFGGNFGTDRKSENRRERYADRRNES